MTPSVPLRVAFWNTWLLRPRLWSDGPAFPGADGLFAPDVVPRASLVGAAIRDRFDVCALAEAFEPSEQRSVVAAMPGHRLVPGPGVGRFRFTGSGLATVVDERRVEVVDALSVAFRTGGDLRDSDTFATKGALLVRVRVDPDLPPVDVVSTHLFAGGEFLPIPGSENHLRHHQVRLRQLDELVDFVADHRQPANPLVIGGDFNVAAHDRHPALSDPEAHHRDLLAKLAPLGVADVWATHGVGAGTTSTFEHAAELPPDPDEPDAVWDDPELDAAHSPGNRIDYLWVAPPLDGGVSVDVDRPRRWAFSGREATGGPAGSLSDHLLLSTTLRLRAT
jgi:endonuclease/exonuclease/phosphatase family metal-dependent hydrolase